MQTTMPGSTTSAGATQDERSAPAPVRFYRPELDCLRFFAFLSVFVFHTFPYDAEYYSARHIPLGWLVASASRAGSFGVDLFFVLSAYLITELLLREKQERGRIHLRAFYVRRILRIWPLYFLAVLIGALLPLLDPGQTFPLNYIAAYLLLAGNWMTSLAGFPASSVMVPLWSVSFEEQFYLLWPAVVSRSKRMRTLWASAGILLLAAQCARIILLKYGRHAESAIFTNTIARLDPLVAGILTAVLMHGRRFALSPMRRAGCLLLGAVVWIAAGHYFALTLNFMIIGYPLMAVGAWLILVSALNLEFAPRWLCYLGKISYGLYVFHMLCLYITGRFLGSHAKSPGRFVVFWWTSLALTVLFSALSYAFVESPFLRLKNRFAYVQSRPV
jgi:peptidoglycan/LPS O-acetylase OafA/YrhL